MDSAIKPKCWALVTLYFNQKHASCRTMPIYGGYSSRILREICMDSHCCHLYFSMSSSPLMYCNGVLKIGCTLFSLFMFSGERSTLRNMTITLKPNLDSFLSC
jgi:hypothetical protein